MLEGVDHLQADVFLHVVEARDVVEAQRGFLLHDPLVSGGPAFGFGGWFLAAGAAARRGVLTTVFFLRVLAVARQLEQLGRHLPPAFSEFRALGGLAQLEHRPGRLEQVDPRRVPLARAAGVEALLLVALEGIPSHGHFFILDFGFWICD